MWRQVSSASARRLSGCSSWKKFDDTRASTLRPPTAPPRLAYRKHSGGADTTGSIVTQPAEPGPSGEPVAPLSKPGLLGDDPNDDVQLGKKYFRGNNFALAENHFHSAVEKHPNDAEAWVGLAASYDRLRRFDLADRAYAQVIRLIGPTVEVLNDEGFSYMLRGDYQRAYKLLQPGAGQGPRQSLRRGQSQASPGCQPRPQGGAVGGGQPAHPEGDDFFNRHTRACPGHSNPHGATKSL